MVAERDIPLPHHKLAQTANRGTLPPLSDREHYRSALYHLAVIAEREVGTAESMPPPFDELEIKIKEITAKRYNSAKRQCSTAQRQCAPLS